MSTSEDSSMIAISEEAMPSEDELKNGARDFELFWLRPLRMAGHEAVLRLCLNGKIGGWKLKDELIESIGLTVGDCVSVEVSVLDGPGIIDDDGDTDLFAGGSAADWLIDTALEAGSVAGCIIDCKVRFVYEQAPVGGNGKLVNKASLVLVEGYKLVDKRPVSAMDFLSSLRF